jgi:hypothetical protein
MILLSLRCLDCRGQRDRSQSGSMISTAERWRIKRARYARTCDGTEQTGEHPDRQGTSARGTAAWRRRVAGHGVAARTSSRLCPQCAPGNLGPILNTKASRLSQHVKLLAPSLGNAGPSTRSGGCPGYPRQRILRGPSGRRESCHFRTHAVQHKAPHSITSSASAFLELT